MSSQALDAEHLLEQYELLRREALQVPSCARRGRGLLLLLTRGMVAWIEAVSCLSRPQAAQPEVTASVTPARLRPEITTVLANMVLVCMQEAPG
jgi:hypothetical protein